MRFFERMTGGRFGGEESVKGQCIDSSNLGQIIKENARVGNSFADMIAYVDENGNLTSTPQDPSRRREVNIEDIQISSPKAEDRNSADQFEAGVVTYYNDEKGYGFIRDSKTKQSVFVHHKQLSGPVGINDKVQFLIVKGMKGPEAIEVSVVTN